ncbi:hypothetical protein COLO4_05620 [Corchorus olitorius]|uniref:Uncharacterized protein n=1 Tax=Corchorus olitorius TaxID=93759 RepID=A0A1R3KQJ3_9ROSI|nr:hypothetical protein COLO4_05620 [Corchorus olitorius]
MSSKNMKSRILKKNELMENDCKDKEKFKRDGWCKADERLKVEE